MAVQELYKFLFSFLPEYCSTHQLFVATALPPIASTAQTLPSCARPYKHHASCHQS